MTKSRTSGSEVICKKNIALSPIETPALRLALSARSLSMAGLVISAAVINVGKRRYPQPNKSTAVTDGAAADEEMRIPLSFLQNTLEQLLLHALASLGLASTLPLEAMQVIHVHFIKN